MSDTLNLLALPHEQALRQMVQAALQPGLSAENLNLGQVVSRDGDRTGIDVHLTAAAYENPSWPFRGQTEFFYRRLNIGDVFAAIPLSFQTPGRLRTRHLIARINSIFNIALEPTDYIDEAIEFDTLVLTYTVKTNPLSQRWRGVLLIELQNLAYVNHAERHYTDASTQPFLLPT